MGTVEVRLVLSNPSTSVFKWPTSSAATTEKEEDGDWKKRGHRKQPHSSLAASVLRSSRMEERRLRTAASQLELRAGNSE